MVALLDINVIIALLDADHDFHQRAHGWWEENAENGWASCPITENGVVRILSHPQYNPHRKLTAARVIGLLQTFAHGTNHQFWPDSLSLLNSDVFQSSKILGPKQISHLYLLALAVAHEAVLVTFDEAINIDGVVEAQSKNLVVL